MTEQTVGTKVNGDISMPCTFYDVICLVGAKEACIYGCISCASFDKGGTRIRKLVCIGVRCKAKTKAIMLLLHIQMKRASRSRNNFSYHLIRSGRRLQQQYY